VLENTRRINAALEEDGARHTRPHGSGCTRAGSAFRGISARRIAAALRARRVSPCGDGGGSR
jgi:hypothetical protein